MPIYVATSQVTSGSVTAMDPTTTEHDPGFPRRPDHPSDGDGGGEHDPTLETTSTGLSQTSAITNINLLGSSLFTFLNNAAADSTKSIDQLQDDNPLAAQVWKFFTKTKQQLPNQQRLKNLTWRMMALSMRKQEKEDAARQLKEQQNRYGFLFYYTHVQPCLNPVQVPLSLL